MDSLPKKRIPSRLLSLISTSASLAALIIGTAAIILNLNPYSGSLFNGGVNTELPTKAQIETVNSEIIAIKQEQIRLTEQINALSLTAPENSLTTDVIGIKNSVSNIDERLTKIEEIIIQDPQKSLEVPLLRKDLENISTTTTFQISAIRQDVERSYNLILVTLVALAVAVFAPSLGNIFKKDIDEKKKKGEDEKE
jgi:hypothetical protein